MIFNTLIYFFVFLAKVGGHHVKKIQNYDTLDEKVTLFHQIRTIFKALYCFIFYLQFDSILDNFQAQWIKKESLLSGKNFKRERFESLNILVCIPEQLNSIDRNHVSKRDLPFIYQVKSNQP